MNYYPPWGMPWGMNQQQVPPVVFMSPPNSPPHNTAQPQSWTDVARLAKREIKREAKLKAKWDADAKKKKEGEQKKPTIPVGSALFLGVLLSPIVGLPTVLFYKYLFQMWGTALGVK